MIEWIKKLFGFAPLTVGEVIVPADVAEDVCCCAQPAECVGNVAPQADVTTASSVAEPVKPKAKRKPYYVKKTSPKAKPATAKPATPKKPKKPK